jgi:hypothetical protein
MKLIRDGPVDQVTAYFLIILIFILLTLSPPLPMKLIFIGFWLQAFDCITRVRIIYHRMLFNYTNFAAHLFHLSLCSYNAFLASFYQFAADAHVAKRFRAQVNEIRRWPMRHSI